MLEIELLLYRCFVFFFSFRILNMLSHCFLDAMVFYEKPVATLIKNLNCFSIATFNILSLSLGFDNWTMSLSRHLYELPVYSSLSFLDMFSCLSSYLGSYWPLFLQIIFCIIFCIYSPSAIAMRLMFLWLIVSNKFLSLYIFILFLLFILFKKYV